MELGGTIKSRVLPQLGMVNIYRASLSTKRSLWRTVSVANGSQSDRVKNPVDHARARVRASERTSAFNQTCFKVDDNVLVCVDRAHVYVRMCVSALHTKITKAEVVVWMLPMLCVRRRERRYLLEQKRSQQFPRGSKGYKTVSCQKAREKRKLSWSSSSKFKRGFRSNLSKKRYFRAAYARY